METITGLKRTHKCGTLREEHVGSEVTVMGWTQVYRNLGGVIFVDLRDRSGIVQVVFNVDRDKEMFEKADTIRSEYVLAVVGEVVMRDPETVNDKVPTGTIEIRAKELRILSKAETPPIYIEENSNVREEVRLKYRYLDLRRPDMQRLMELRHKVCKLARDYFDGEGFLEIETPMLTKSTPEGARDYLVPSRVHPGHFYALPQSPQLYKQLLMLSGMDRYMQIVKCFRDEDLRADRQPEFTQIDLEMSFVNIEDVLSVNEGFMKKIFKEILGIDIQTPFRRMTYQEAMDRFGSDKPDTRFGLELVDLSDVVANCGFKVFADVVAKGGSVRAINCKGGDAKLSRRDLDALVDFVKIYKAKGMAWINVGETELKSPITKFLSQEEIDGILQKMGAEVGDIIMFVADRNEIVYDSLGALRLELARRFDLLKKDEYDLLWVTDFPLFEYSEEDKRYVAKHHPFTMPVEEDIPLLSEHPEQVHAKAYDMIFNGNEVGGGSLRIFNTELQQKMFEALGFTKEKAWEQFGYLMNAFRYGTPPHGGMAYGLDRLVMLLAGRDSIRDVIAFPKVKDASELMTEAPTNVDPKQLKELHLKLDDLI
ncbi:MAG: aspartate--tRNA ligase [Ruminococcaceae bacterium]|nr:aspartate--tRNA ligase [Oscillospiraceae bacterium]